MMYTRGQFAIIGKVGRKALRLYEEKGILVPAVYNEVNGYHYYEQEQLSDLFRIKQYQKYGLSLDEIAEILLDGADVKQKLTEHRVTISQEIQDQILVKRQLEKLLQNSDQKESLVFNSKSKSDLESGTNSESASIQRTLFQHKIVLYRDENIEREHLGMPVGKLHELAAAYSLPITGPHFVKYSGLQSQDGVFEMQVCLPIQLDKEQQEKGPMGEFVMMVPDMRCIYLSYKDGFSTVWKAHQIMIQYAEEHQINLDGNVIEEYRMDHTVGIYYGIQE